MINLAHNTIKMPLPPLGPRLDQAFFHQYEKEETSLFVPFESANVLKYELLSRQGNLNEQQREAISSIRDYYQSIPQLNKLGPDGIHHLYSSGVILTLDLLVGYFDEVTVPSGEKRDVLHIVLLWSQGKPQEGDPAGWVLPGKRDQAYAVQSPDISIKEANFSLVEKEIGLDRTQVAHHSVLAYFDDRIREQRFKGSGFLSFVLLKTKPQLEPGRRIGVPLNALKFLAERRIAIPPLPGMQESWRMSRNHDSLILAAFQTAAFYHTMEKIKLNQARFREIMRQNPHAERPPISTLEPGQECRVCMELLVNVHIICTNGHSLCGICLPLINACPTCREPKLAQPLRNRDFEDVIKQLNPAEYQSRYREANQGQIPPTWAEDPTFCGDAIIYKG